MKSQRGRKPKVYDNKAVAKWLMETRYKNLDVSLRTKLPAFVDDAVYGGLYVYKLNNTNPIPDVSPSVIYRCLMLEEISVKAVENICSGYGYSYADRTLRRIAQIVRFISKGIETRISEYEETHTDVEKDRMFDWKMEQRFIWCYNNGVESRLYSKPLPQIPDEIVELYRKGDYLEWIKRASEFYKNK